MARNADSTPTSRDLEGILDQTLNPEEPARSAFLLVLSGEHPGRLFPLDRPERIIGRSKHADISIDQQSISHRHAKIVSADGVHRLIDLGSTNGTYVNDVRVEGQVDLRGGDVIRLGETTLSFLVPGENGELPTVAIEHIPLGIAARPAPRQLPPHAYQPRRASYPEFEVRSLDDGPSLRDLLGRIVTILRFLGRHRLALIVSGLVAAALGGVSAFVMPPAGVAEFEVKLTPKTATNPVEQVERPNVEFFGSAETAFRSRDLLRLTLGSLGEKTITDDLLTRTRDKLKFDSTGLMTYRGSYTDRTPERALAFLDRHVKIYLDTEIEKTLKVIHAEVEFLKGQLTQNEADLTRTEAALRDFKQQHIDGLPEQAEGQFTARLALKQRQTELAAEVERAGLELGSAKSRFDREEPVLDQKVLSSQPYQQGVIEVNRKLGEARANGLGEQHPDVLRLKKQAEELTALSRQAIASDVSDVERRTNPAFKAMRDRVAELEVRRNAASKELGRISGDLAKLDKVVKDLPEVEAKYSELTRSYAATKALHTKLFERFKAAELQLELERASATARYEILTTPAVQKASLRKVTAMRVGIGAAIGLLLALLVVIFLEARQYVRENL